MKKIWIFLIKIAIAFLIISYLFYKHQSSVTANLQNFRAVWLVPALLLLYAEMTICAIRWYYLLKLTDINLSLRETVSLTMRGYFCSLILPGGAIGGDVAKIGIISHAMPKGERFEPNLSILIDRIVGMIALFGIAMVLIIADLKNLLQIDLSAIGISARYNKYLIAVVFLGCLAGIALATVLFFAHTFEKIPFCKTVLDKADRISGGMINRMKLALAIYRKHWKSLILMIAGSVFFVHLLQMPILASLCVGLGIKISSFLTLSTAIILGNIAGLIPLTPGGLGLRDVTILAILNAGNFSDATSIPLLMSLVLIIGNLSAGLAFFDKGLQRSTVCKTDTHNLQGTL